MNITLQQNQKIIEIALTKSKHLAAKMNSSDKLYCKSCCFLKMDDAWLGSIDIAHKKPEQRDISINSGKIRKLSQSVQPLSNI
nr:hypothetical protein [uncultured Chryseobacterium sp.]